MEQRANSKKSLESERLLLRPLTLADAEAVYLHWASDPAVTKYLRWEPNQSVADSETWLGQVEQLYAEGRDYCYGMERKSDGRLVGSIGAFYHEESGRYEVGYCLERALWGQGYMTEALARLVRFLTEEEHILRFSCSHSPENPASGRVMQKCGFVFQNKTEPCYNAAGEFLFDSLLYHLDTEPTATK